MIFKKKYNGKIVNAFYKIRLFLSIIKYKCILRIFYKRHIDELVKMKDIHLNKRCFIIGNGPSLKPEDLELLKNEITFGANKIYNIFNETKWRPTYYLVQDPVTLNNIKENIEYVKSSKTFISFTAKIKSRFYNTAKNIVYFYINSMNYPEKDPYFSKNVSKEISEGYTVTYSAIQFASYFGFKEIYLLGVDFNYSITIDENGQIIQNNNIKNYFGKSSDNNVPDSVPNLVYNLKAFKAAKDYADINNIKIYNATRGGNLNVFERVNLDDII